MHNFSCTLNKLQVTARNSDWFMVLFAPVVIGQSDYFGTGFFDSHLKTTLFSVTFMFSQYYEYVAILESLYCR